ncbi:MULTISPECIES: serine/threonine-protein kinase [Bifidobacterium]|uniref:serine/threonine-protein kinase n=1 Tax=Bifidobacterium TaxID=1678 RepID=UPI001BDD3AB4|nr:MULTISPECIES: serine/threonine-protein kinase [Bifidobacterium]MBT1162258.1 protein kinase [Bifidobacterium sp. SO1]MBW3079169.1 protein kinase [Bifidobacterium simiiventris]
MVGMSDLSALNLQPGDLIGGYTLVSRLGAGAMGSVWRVRDDGGQEYAMKILRDSLTDTTDDENDDSVRERVTARERLRREAMALKKVDHPGVCGIVDMELDDSVAFIVTELIEGKNLREDVRINGRYTGDDLERLARKLIAAVKAVHDAGIVHRDIKPTNVMVSAAGPVLVDFGIAMTGGESHVTRTGLVMGTPGFIAPEIIDGAESDAMTDWWSVASVLAFAATGEPVFGTKPMMAVLERAAAGNANLTGLPAGTMAAFRAALNPDRNKRCTPDQLLHAIALDALNPRAWQDAAPAAQTALDASETADASDSTEVVRPFDGAVASNPRLLWRDEPSFLTDGISASAGFQPARIPSAGSGEQPASSAPPYTEEQPAPSLLPQGKPSAQQTEGTQETSVMPNDAPSPTAVLPNLPAVAASATTVLPHDIPAPATAVPRETPSETTVPPNDAAYATAVLPNMAASSGEAVPTSVLSGTTTALPTQAVPSPDPAQISPIPPLPAAVEPQPGSIPPFLQEVAAAQPTPPPPVLPYAQSFPQLAFVTPDMKRADYLTRGLLPLWLLTIPLAILAASMPGVAVCAASGALWLLLTIGYSTESQLERETRHGGERQRFDGVKRTASLPWHLLKALAASVPHTLAICAIMTAMAVAATFALSLPVTHVTYYIADRMLTIPLLDDTCMSLSGLTLGAGAAVGWILSTFASRGAMLRIGCGALRGPSPSLANPGTNEYGATDGRPTNHRGMISLAIWAMLTFAATLPLLFGNTIDWWPLIGALSTSLL